MEFIGGIITAAVLAAIILSVAGLAWWARSNPSQDPDNAEAMNAIR